MKRLSKRSSKGTSTHTPLARATRVSAELENLVVRLAREDSGWGDEVLAWRGLVGRWGVHCGNERPSACELDEVRARNATLDELGHLHGFRHVLRYRGAKCRPKFWQTLVAGGVKCL